MFRGFVQEMAEATGLPKDIWPSPPPLQNLSNVSHWDLDQTPATHEVPLGERKGLHYHPQTVMAVEKLSAAHVLGQAVLVRPSFGVTTMTTIAEAACATFGPDLAELLWVILQVLERSMRSPEYEFHARKFKYRWKRNFSDQSVQMETLMQENRKRDFKKIERSEATSLRKKRKGEDLETPASKLVRQQQDELSAQFAVIRKQNNEILRRDNFSSARPVFESIRQRQAELSNQFNNIRRQNNEILSLLEAANSASKPVQDLQHQETLLPSSQRNSVDEQAWIKTEKTESDVYMLYVNGSHRAETSLLLDWLESALGGYGFERLSSVEYLQVYRVESENQNSLYTFQPKLQDCWRHKFASGNIHSLLPATVPRSLTDPPENTTGNSPATTSTLSQHFPDSLALTAAALWSLFDNVLEWRPKCRCTLNAPGGAHLQCRKIWGNWLVWHLVTRESGKPSCIGDQCHSNIRVSLSEEQDCVTLQTTTPCILGWSVETRTQPSAPLWDVLPVSKSFQQRELTSYTLKAIEVQAHLLAPLSLSPQIGGAATFGKIHYGIEQSVDHSSLLALEMTAVATVLIYDELRGVHLLCEGADIIEIICVQYLRNLGLEDSRIPSFSRSTPITRLRTWYSTAFNLRTGRRISGDDLVRQATSLVSQLNEAVKIASKISLPYWSLEEVMRGGVISPIKRPHAKSASWEALASKSPPLILAVGAIRLDLMGAAKETFSKRAMRAPFNFLQRFSTSESSGIITDLQRMKIWLQRARFLQEMILFRTADTIKLGGIQEQQDFILRIKECQADGQDDETSIEDLCRVCTHVQTNDCVHLVK